MKRDTRYYQQHGLLRIFLSYFGPHRRLFLLDMLCALFIGAVDLIFPLISRRAINTMLPAHAYHTFFVVMGIMAAAYLVRAFFYYIIAYYGHTFGIRVEADIRRDLFRHMQSLGYEFYDHNRTGQLMSRLTTDLFEITELAHHGPEDLMISLLTIVGALAVMFTIEWRLALVVCVILPILLIVVITRRRKMSRASRGVKKRTAAINAEIESSLSGIRTAKAFANEAVEFGKFSEANDRFKVSKHFLRLAGVFPLDPERGRYHRGRHAHHAGPDGSGRPVHVLPVYLHVHKPCAQAREFRRDVRQRLCGPRPLRRADAHGAEAARRAGCESARACPRRDRCGGRLVLL